MKSLVLLLASPIFALAPATAGQATVEWRALRPDAADTGATQCVTDHSGNVYVVFESWGSNQPVELVKFAPDGQMLWRRGAAATTAAVALAASDEVVFSADFGPATLVVRLDSQGVVRWTRALAGVKPAALLIDSLDRAVIAGTAGGDWSVRALASDGADAWTTVVDDPSHLVDTAHCMTIDAAGDVFVAGGVGSEAAVAKLSSQGALQWLSVWSAPYDSAAYAHIVSDGQGGAIAAGDLQFTWQGWPPGQQYVNHQISRFGAQGQVVWLHPSYGIPVNSVAKDVVLDGSARIWAAIQIDPYAFQKPSVHLERIALDGTTLSQFDYDGPSHEGAWPASLALDEAGRVLLGATCGYFFGSATDRSVLMRMDDTANPAWTKLLDAPSIGVRSRAIRSAPGKRVIVLGEGCHALVGDLDGLVMQLALDDPAPPAAQ
jgi:hypothetical protein